MWPQHNTPLFCEKSNIYDLFPCSIISKVLFVVTTVDHAIHNLLNAFVLRFRSGVVNSGVKHSTHRPGRIGAMECEDGGKTQISDGIYSCAGYPGRSLPPLCNCECHYVGGTTELEIQPLCGCKAPELLRNIDWCQITVYLLLSVRGIFLPKEFGISGNA